MMALVHCHPLLGKLIFFGYFFFCTESTDTSRVWFSRLGAVPVTRVGVAAVPIHLLSPSFP